MVGEYEIPDEAMDEFGQQEESAPESQSQEPEVQQQQDQQQPKPEWDGNQWQLKYRGNPYVPKSRDELVNLAQKGFSYSQELERFNNDRRTLTGQMDQLKKSYAKYDDFDNALKSNPALAQRIMAVIEEHNSGKAQPEGAQNGRDWELFNKLNERLDALENGNSERLEAEYDRKLSEALQKVRQDHPEHDWETDTGTGNLEQQLIQFAHDNGINNVEHAYRVMMYEHNGTEAKAKALKDAAKATQDAKRAGVMNGGQPAGGAPQKKPYNYGDSYNDLARRMVNEMKS